MKSGARSILIVLAALSASLICGGLVAAWQIVQAGNRRVDGIADAALVLGAAAWGNRPSPVYRERIVEAVTLYKAGKVQWIILTGGSPRAGYPSEALVGRQFCVANGVPLRATLMDENSRSTWDNLVNAQRLMTARSIKTVLLVSDPLHMRRALKMADDLGVNALPAPTPSSRFRSTISRAKFLWRETWLYLAYLILGVRN